MAHTIVTNKSELLAALDAGTEGDIVTVNALGNAIDLSGESAIAIKAGVVLRGPAVAAYRQRLYTTTTPNPLFTVAAGAKVYNLNIDGPHTGTSTYSPLCSGLRATGEETRFFNCDISGFSYYGIWSNALKTHIRNCYFHENQGAGYGYGVLVSSNSDATVLFSRFRRCRHGITGSGGVGCSFYVRHNYFGYPATTNQAAVDMHPSGSGEARLAGENIIICDNVFDMANETYPTSTSTYYSMDLQGTPRGRALIARNYHFGGRGPITRYQGAGYKFVGNRFFNCRNMQQTYTLAAPNLIDGVLVPTGLYYTERPWEE